jgi:predicted NBD/HSP70 family sugar kinase
MAAGLVVEDGMKASTGGRRAVRLRFADEVGVVLAGHLGATKARLALTDLSGRILSERSTEWPIRVGPVRTLEWLVSEFDQLLALTGRSRADLKGIGIGVPGPVEHATGRPVSPGLMPGWDDYPVAEQLSDQYGVPALVDNDVNLMALGEYESVWRGRVANLLFVKVGTGIGCGIIASGRIYRGAQGAAGDIGHVRVPGREDLCRCGNSGCLGAVVGGEPIARRLSAAGLDAPDARSVSRLALAGEYKAIHEVRDAGRVIGEVLAAVVNFFNPAVIVVGGAVAEAHEQLLAGMREVVYQRSLALATRQLQLVHSELGDAPGVIGASLMVIEDILSPEAVNRSIKELASSG